MLGDDSLGDFSSRSVPRTGSGARPDGVAADLAQGGQGQPAARKGGAAEPGAAPAGSVARGRGAAGRPTTLPYIVAILLFAFGAFESILYFGHKIVPNSDAPSFVRVGRELLSGQMPSSFKRAPLVGLLEVGLSHLVGGPHPELTAGWLLNAILHPFTVVLLWLIARRLIGRWAWCLALVTALNPWWLLNLREPVAETTLHFFVAATFYAIFTRSRWRYGLASLAAVVRYDAAALLLVVLLLDLVQRPTTRQRVRSVLCATAVALPLGLWLLGTALHFDREGATYYLNEMGANAPLWKALGSYLSTLWTVVVSPLFHTPPGLSDSVALVFSLGVGIALCLGLGCGIVRAGAERCWEVLGLWTFLLAYLIVHGLHSFVMPRFCSTLLWMVLLLAMYGFRSGWLLLRTRIPLPARLVLVLQGVSVLVIGLWAIHGASLLSGMAAYSARSVSVPYAALAVVCLILLAEWSCLEQRRPLREVLVLASLCLVILSNQYTLVRVMGNGRQDIEFKLLADWYRRQAGPQDKLATTYADVVGLYLPNRGENLIHMAQLKAGDERGFLRNCRKERITYLAWDSRLGCHPEDRYYELYGLANLRALGNPESWGPFEFVIQFQVNEGRWINIFRWRPSAPDLLIPSGAGSDPNRATPAAIDNPDRARPDGILAK